MYIDSLGYRNEKFLKSLRGICLSFTAGNTETKMSLEDKHAKANKYMADMVTVLPSTSPNRRFLAFILVAVAVVALVVLIATLLPIYMTGGGEDKENG